MSRQIFEFVASSPREPPKAVSLSKTLLYNEGSAGREPKKNQDRKAHLDH